MSALPTRADLAGDPSRATLQTILLAMYDMVAQRLAAGTTGAGTASAAELLLARNSLGLGAGADIASAATLDLTARTGNVVRITGTTGPTTAITMNNGDVVLAIAAAAWPINVAGVLTYTCTAEDVVLLTQDDDGVQKAVILVGRAGTGNIGPVELATAAEFLAGIDASRVPSVQVIRENMLVLNASVATTSGTEKDWTGIPEWATEVDIHLIGVSTNGTSQPIIQLGTSLGFETSGYSGSTSVLPNSAAISSGNFTTGFRIVSADAAYVLNGVLSLKRATSASDTWSVSAVIGNSASVRTHILAGIKGLAGVFTQVRLTTDGGGNTFDAGSWCVNWR